MNREKTWAHILEIAYGGGPAKGAQWYDAEEEAKVDAALKEDPYNHSLLTAKAILNFNHDPEIAIENFSRALAIKPLDAHQHYNRGRKYLYIFRHAEGLADLEESVKLDPEENWAWHFLGVGYYLEGRFVEAISHFEKSLEVSMRHHQDLISCEAAWLWDAHMHLGQTEEAEAAIIGITLDTLIVPVIGDDEMYRDTCLLLNGTMPVEDYIANIRYDSVFANEEGTVGPESYHNVAKFYYYVEKDLAKAVEYVRKVLATPTSPLWAYRKAAMDGPVWEAEYKATGTA